MVDSFDCLHSLGILCMWSMLGRVLGLDSLLALFSLFKLKLMDLKLQYEPLDKALFHAC